MTSSTTRDAERTIGILLYPDAEELDWVGPWEVFAGTATVEPLRVVTIAEHAGLVRNAKGLRVQPDHDFDDAPRLDVVVVPGGQGSRVEMNNPRLIDWLRDVAAGCTWVTSVCTGAILVCKAGLAEGREVTTHWNFIEDLRKLAPNTRVRDDVRYVRDGNLVTAAGVSAGIDMSLWLVGQMYGEKRGRQVQRGIQYEPEPPF